MTSDAVLYHRDAHVGVITLNRPDNRNSMTAELLDAFAAATAQARADRSARCIVITGTGRCFSAGADFKSQIQRNDPTRQAHERSYAMYEPFLSVLDIEVPVIGALQGHTVGGGFGLALVCDIRLGNREAKYGANFTKLGLAPGMAISYLLPRLVGASRAAELLYAGRLVLGEEAASLGILSRAVDGDEVLAEAMALANEIAANAPVAIRLTKRAMNEGLNWQPKQAAFREAFAQALSLTTDDAKEGMAALLEKRTPDFHGR